MGVGMRPLETGEAGLYDEEGMSFAGRKKWLFIKGDSGGWLRTSSTLSSSSMS
jgi:hypothetical protein